MQGAGWSLPCGACLKWHLGEPEWRNAGCLPLPHLPVGICMGALGNDLWLSVDQRGLTRYAIGGRFGGIGGESDE